MKCHTVRIAAAVAATLAAATASAGPEKIAYPAGFDKGVLYGTVDRYDTKQYRELYTSKAVVDAVKAGKPIPPGATITMAIYKAKVDDKGVPVKGKNGRFEKGDPVAHMVMMKNTGWGSEYGPEKRNGEWEYQAFAPDGKVNDKANLGTCFACHKPHDGQDYVISLARFKPGKDGKVNVAKAPDVVAIGDFLFGPEKLEVAKNTYVTWVNTDDSPHQVTVTSANGLRTPVILKGEKQAMKFETPGVYDYICGLHPGMKGKIEVK
jgi:plastocyanin